MGVITFDVKILLKFILMNQIVRLCAGFISLGTKVSEHAKVSLCFVRSGKLRAHVTLRRL